MRRWKEGEIRSQHGGQDGDDTAWIEVPVENPDDWLRRYGGSLSDAIRVLSQITGFKVKNLGDDLEE